jgi:hypothetical protein
MNEFRSQFQIGNHSFPYPSTNSVLEKSSLYPSKVNASHDGKNPVELL